MEYDDLVQAHLDQWNRDVRQIVRANEARRFSTLNRGWPNPLAHFDSLVLRASKGAAERQARRIGSQNSPEPMA